MAIGFQLSASGNKTSTNGTTIAVTISSTAGDMVIVGVAFPSTSISVSSITDTGGNTYHRIATLANGTLTVELWKTDSVSPLATGGTVTVTLSGTGARATAEVATYRGVAFAGEGGQTHTGTTSPITSGSTTLVEPNSDWLIFYGAEAGVNVFTAQNGSLRVQDGTTGIRGVLIDSNGAASPVTCSATFTAATWAGLAVELRLLGSTQSENLNNWADGLTSHLDLALGLADDNGPNWADSLTVSIGLALTDNEGSNWAEVVTPVLSLLVAFTDALVLSDQASAVLGSSQPSLTLSDTLVFNDSLLLGYGQQIKDQLLLQDVSPVLTGQYVVSIICPHLSDWQEAIIEQFSHIAMPLTDFWGTATVNNLWFDAFASLTGLGFNYSDALTLSDAVVVDASGIGVNLSDALTLTDVVGLGYGDLITDQLVLTESFASVLGGGAALSEALADALVMSDATLLLLGDLLSFSDQLVLSDVAALLFTYGSGFSDTLTITDSSGLGYGFSIADGLSLSDTLASLFSFAEIVADTLTLTDALVVGYGQGPVDSLTLVDSTSVGYGDIISDQLILSDAEAAVLACLELLSDQLVLSDAINVGYGNLFTDQLTLADFVLLGYGDLLSDQLVLSDAIAINAGQALQTEVLADALTLVDVVGIGYGSGVFETLTIVDSSALGYGLGIADALLLTDTAASVLLELILIADTLSLGDAATVGYGQGSVDALTLSDASGIGYGDLIADTLVMTDAFAFNAGQAAQTEVLADTLTMLDALSLMEGFLQGNVDQLVLVDASGLGYGDVISDQLLLSDVLSLLKTFGLSFSETITISDATFAGYGLGIVDILALTDSLGFNLSSSSAQFSDSLTLLDGLAVGYGLLFSEVIVLVDAVQVSTGQPNIVLNLADQLSLVEQLISGYGFLTGDQVTLADSTSFLESLLLLINEATPAQQDALQSLFNAALVLQDAGVLQDQLATTWGILFAGDSLALADQLTVSLQNLIALALAEPDVANWLDAVLTSMVFAPGKIVLASLRVFNEVDASASVSGEIQAGQLFVKTEV